MSPVLAEIMMKGWEGEKLEKERKIRKFGRYENDSLGIWKGKKTELEEKVKEIEDKEKGIKLKSEVKNEGKITFWIQNWKKIKKAEVRSKK